MSPMRKPFRTADGYACLPPYTDRNWRDFLAFAGRPEVAEDPRFRTLADRAQHDEAGPSVGPHRRGLTLIVAKFSP